MSKRAEQRGLEALPPRWRKTKDGKGKVDGALPVRKFYIRAYEQAEKDTIERVISWVRKNAYIYTDTQNDEEGNLMTVFLEEAFTNDLKKAMEEEE